MAYTSSMICDGSHINIDMNGPLIVGEYQDGAGYHSDTSYTHLHPRYHLTAATKVPFPILKTELMSNMERYVHGPEDPYFADRLTGGFLHTNNIYRPAHPQFDFNQPYEAPFPDAYGRYSSPVSSGSQSSQRSWGPWRSEDLQASPRLDMHSPCEITYADVKPVFYGAGIGIEPQHIGKSCSMADVQSFQDDLPVGGFDSEIKLEQSPSDFGTIKVHYQPKDDADSWDDHESIPDNNAEPSYQYTSHEEAEDDADYKPPKSKTRRRRSRASQSSLPSPTKIVNRRASHNRKASLVSPKSTHDLHLPKKLNKHKRRPSSKDESRHFACPLTTYGCQSTFSSKNEWKRHVSTQHLRLGFWRCDLCPTTTAPSKNQTTSPPKTTKNGIAIQTSSDFNRKDLFTQHLRRMHSRRSTADGKIIKEDLDGEELAAHQSRCYKRVRSPPPSSSCLFCPAVFSGEGSWDKRMEHIGQHLEGERKSAGENGAAGELICAEDDEMLRDWYIDEGLVVSNGMGGWKVGDGVPIRAR